MSTEARSFVAEEFLTDTAMYMWLASERSEELQRKYPPPRYGATLNVFERKVIVTDKGEQHE